MSFSCGAEGCAPVSDALYLGVLWQSNNIQCCIAAMRILQASQL